MNELILKGCRPDPLASYLKSLGVFRLLSTQCPSETFRMAWNSGGMVLHSSLTYEQILSFFLNDYAPTPITAPWNRGSGFRPNDKAAREKGIQVIKQSEAPRLQRFKETIRSIEKLRQDLQITDIPEKKEKDNFLRQIRARADDHLLSWIDAVFVLTAEGTKYPPLLGTGGNDGHLDFTSNFMQRLTDIFDSKTGAPSPLSESWLRSSFLGLPSRVMASVPIGQFYPGMAGGPNAGCGFKSDSTINPWDYILLLEGALLFTASSHRQLESCSSSSLAYPFTVKSTAAGYGTAMGDEKSAEEIWLPLWKNPAAYDEIKYLFSEGRVQVGRRHASTGLDFARAIASLGVDRGITIFTRYGFLERNGQSSFAIPLGRWEVSHNPNIAVLEEVDEWVSRYRRAAQDKSAPESLRRAIRSFDEAAMQFCRNGHAVAGQRVLIALSDAELALITMRPFCEKRWLGPLPPLSESWFHFTDDQSIECAIAASVASIFHKTDGSIRMNIEPVEVEYGTLKWARDTHVPRVVWKNTGMIRNMGDLLLRRCMDAHRQGITPLPLDGRFPLPLEYVAAFLSGQTNDRAIEALIPAFSLIDWRKIRTAQPTSPGHAYPVPAYYAITKLCLLPEKRNDQLIPYEPDILSRLAAGDLSGAVQSAARRLTGSGFPVTFRHATAPPRTALRLLASLLIPVNETARQKIIRQVVIPEKE